MQNLKETCGLAIQDDYETWNRKGRGVMYAKPLLIDQSDYDDTLQIFFDDHASK